MFKGGCTTMIRKYKFVSAAASLLMVLSIIFLSSVAGPQGGLRPTATLDLGGSKVNGFVSTSDGKYLFISVSVGRESSVFLVAANSATLEFYGKKIRGCPIAGEICLVQIRGNINPQDLAYNEAKKVLFVPGFDDDTLYISQVAFDKDGKPTEAKAAKKVAVGSGPRAVAVNAEGTRAFTVNERDHTVSVVDVLYKGDAPDKAEVIATIKLDPNEENPTYPSPADILLYGDKAYVVNTDTWKVCEITNINADSEKVKKGEEKIALGACVDTGAYPRAIATIGNTAYVINSTGDSVTQLSLAPLKAGEEVEVGDAPRGIATDNRCWIVVTNTGVDRGGASVTFLSKDLKKSLTMPIDAAIPGDPIVPTQVQLVPQGDSLALWVLNVGARGQLNNYGQFISRCE
jgi:DNA-binding beta-propeller fold protein YncE